MQRIKFKSIYLDQSIVFRISECHSGGIYFDYFTVVGGYPESLFTVMLEASILVFYPNFKYSLCFK